MGGPVTVIGANAEDRCDRCQQTPRHGSATRYGQPVTHAGVERDMIGTMTNAEGLPDSIVVFGPEGRPLGISSPTSSASRSAEEDAEAGAQAEADGDDPLADMVEQPAKVMRIGTMIKQLLEEVRAAPLDEASRNRLKEIHQTSVRELEQGLAPELRDELERLALPFEDGTPSDAELRVAQAQLVGWLEGLFHGIQTALFAQQMAARAQLEQMRHALPRGAHLHDGGQPGGGSGTGQYL